MPQIKGRSGVLHEFEGVEYVQVPDGSLNAKETVVVKVVSILQRDVTDTDVIGFYAKALDVAAHEMEMRGANFSGEARRVAAEYRINIVANPLTITG